MNAKFDIAHAPIKLYRNPKSGHSHRVELMLSLLDLPYEYIDLDMANGAHKAPEYLQINPFGQVPAIDDNGVVLSDSNAILIYLEKKYNDGYEWLPQDPVKAAEVQRWLSVAAGEIAYGPCAVRLVKVFGAPLDYDAAKQKTESLFALLEPHLESQNYLTGEKITLADVAGYSYISHVPEGGVSLEPYPAIRAWLARIEAQPRFVGMARSPLPESK
ncbi:glutathione S-transferase [Vibrio vulnificus]|uniref:glutathione S-transferase family protein n=1 Tax=Vibrio vulnificus TaxID=672 RepID=UPI00102A140A|nr:glutathione S-transferase [Vibrio vulnificus]EGQ7996634.1 glutathione S-transferase [Vibrio vulnificus]RZP71731.1 glutathione S-transferase [Vibrio vulnificus]RZP71816.1 glutathione S-transferase [Vibrio vulnificus]RZQ09544.1 glutathione S-transferase [Vibrio vulnificus]